MEHLPEKWFIRFGNKEQAEEYIIPYFQKKYPGQFAKWIYTGEDRCFSSDGRYFGWGIGNSFREISFDDFKRLVLGHNNILIFN